MAQEQIAALQAKANETGQIQVSAIPETQTGDRLWKVFEEDVTGLRGRTHIVPVLINAEGHLFFRGLHEFRDDCPCGATVDRGVVSHRVTQ